MKAYVEPEEVILMEKATTNLRDRLLIRLLFHLGCRISEALALKVEDIDFTQGTVIIVHLKTRLKLSCPHCSAGISVGHTFCPKCGLKVVEAVAKELVEVLVAIYRAMHNAEDAANDDTEVEDTNHQKDNEYKKEGEEQTGRGELLGLPG